MLDALDLLGDDDWSRLACVEIQGGDPLQSLVLEHVASLRAKGRPIQAGRLLAEPEAEAAIERADWILIPSPIESMPLVFSDAMKLGRPVISMPVGDLTRLVGANAIGHLAGVTSAVSHADDLGRALQDARQRHASALLEMRKRFDLSEAALRIVSDLELTAEIAEAGEETKFSA